MRDLARASIIALCVMWTAVIVFALIAAWRQAKRADVLEAMRERADRKP